MKKWGPLVFSLGLLMLFTACKSPEEKRMAIMVDRLDSAYAVHEADLKKVFNSMEKMKSALEPGRIYHKGEESQLQGEAAEVWASLEASSYGVVQPGKSGKIQPDEPLILGQNAWIMAYNDSLWNAHSTGFFDTWADAPNLHFNHIYDYYDTGNWEELFYNESHISINGEDRDDFLRMGLQVMPHLSQCRYFIVSQPVLFAPGTWEGNSFDYGVALNKVEIWDMEKGAFIGQGWVKAVHSFSVFGVSYSEETKAASRRKTLRDDLLNNLNKELRSGLSIMVGDARFDFPKWE